MPRDRAQPVDNPLFCLRGQSYRGTQNDLLCSEPFISPMSLTRLLMRWCRIVLVSTGVAVMIPPKTDAVTGCFFFMIVLFPQNSERDYIHVIHGYCVAPAPSLTARTLQANQVLPRPDGHKKLMI